MHIYTIFNIITTILVIYIMNKKGNPYFKLAWMIPILVFPIFGALFYMFVEFQIGGKLINNRLSEVIDETQKFLSQDENVINELKREDMQVANLARYMISIGKYPIYNNTVVKYFPSCNHELLPRLFSFETFEFSHMMHFKSVGSPT